jgi:hypothetical protein
MKPYLKYRSAAKSGESRSKKTKLFQACLLAFCITIFPLGIMAEEAEHSPAEGVHAHRHHVALFLGATHTDEEDEFSIGMDYEYRLNPLLGLGGIAEYTGGEHETTIAAAAFFIHPFKALRLVLGPGFESGGDEKEFLLRVGASYHIPVGKLTLAPEFNVDFVDGNKNLVYGISLGWGF